MEKRRAKRKGHGCALITVIFILIVAAVVALCVHIGGSGTELTNNTPVSAGANEMVVTELALGDGDCTVVMTDSGTVMIDSGEYEDADDIISFLTASGVNSIDYFILTNFDESRIGGASNVINRFDVKRVIVPDVLPLETDDDEYMRLISALDGNDITPYVAVENLGFTLSDASFTVYSGTKDAYSSDQSENMSLVVSAAHGNNKFLFASDIKEERISDIMSRESEFGHNYLKVPCHGEFEKNSDEFFSLVNPTYAVISNGSAGKAKKAASVLKNNGAQVFVTKRHNVCAVSNLNENEIKVYQ